MMIYAVALLSICLGAAGQFGLKLGAAHVKVGQGVAATILSLVFNPSIAVSLLGFAASMVMWVFVLRRLELSIAYPMVSLGYIITMALAFTFLNEPLRLTKLIGAALIIAGVVVINIR